MFLWFIKPRGKKVYSHDSDYRLVYNIYAPLLLVKIASAMAWFICIPYLIMDYGQTIRPFIIVTIVNVVSDFLSKILNPERRYF
jgi:hypothetical protein